MDSNFRFLVARPSNRHGRSDRFLETWSGSVGEPEVGRSRRPPAVLHSGPPETATACGVAPRRPLKPRSTAATPIPACR
jgi:hypothetical protein